MSTSRKALFTLAALGLAAFAAHPASAQTTISGLFDTGVDASGVSRSDGSANDLNYSLTYLGLDGTSSPITEVTEVRTSVGGYPIGPYIGDSSTSAWIGPNTGTYGNNLAGPVGYYDYQTTFMVSGLDAGFTGSTTITGNWASDNTGPDILINGVSTKNTTSSEYTGYTAFTINATGLKNGTNKIDFLVYNAPGADDNPTALRVDGIKASDPTASAAPEPSQVGMLVLFAAGLGALVVKARKRKTATLAA